VIDPLALDLYSRLVALDTTSSATNLPAIELLAGVLDRRGTDLRILRSPDGRKANLWARLGPPVDAAGRGGLVLSGHTDCVPALEDDWSSDPFRLTDRGDRWVGRGAADMKGFVALAAALAVRLDPASLTRPLGLLFTFDEEVGMLGARDFARAWPADEPLPRAWVIGEPTSLAVVRMHKGHLKLRVALAGRPAHSGTPQLGDNAIEKSAPVVAALAALRRALESERPELGEFFPEAPFVPLNVARIDGGVALNVVPDRCTIDLGTRPLPAADVEALRARIEAVVRDAAPGASLETLGWSEPLLTAEASPIHRELLALTGQRDSRGAPFATDGGPLSALDIDAVVWGPGDISVAHRADEWMPKADMERASRLLVELVDRFCGGASA
jgi:acetylornithine deacetylase